MILKAIFFNLFQQEHKFNITDMKKINVDVNVPFVYPMVLVNDVQVVFIEYFIFPCISSLSVDFNINLGAWLILCMKDVFTYAVM